MAPPSVAAAQQPPPLLAAPNAAAATATTSEEDFKAAEQRFHACARHDVDTRLNLLAELAALKPAEAWQLYIRMRATDLAEALPPLAVVPSGLAAPAAFELRRCVAWVGRTALAQDMQLLVGSFASVGTVPQLLDHLYLNTVASLASGAIAGACRAAATSSAAVRTVANVDWPAAVRESSAVCDALCELDAVLTGTATAASSIAAGSLSRLDRAQVMGPFASTVARETSDHVQLLVRRALQTEATAGPGRGTWVAQPGGWGERPSNGAAGRACSCVLLGSVTTILSSLSLHAGGPAFGAVALIDVALCEAIRAATEGFANHVGMLADAAASTVAGTSALSGEGAAGALAASASGLSASARAVIASDGSLLVVCLASVEAMRDFVRGLERGTCRGSSGASVPAIRWADDSCVTKLQVAHQMLTALSARLQVMVCEGASTLACSAVVEALGNDAPFWSAAIPWRKGRCSLPMQFGLSQICVCKGWLGSLGAADLAELLHVRTVRRVAHKLLRAYWQAPTPSAARHPTFLRDLHLLTAFVASEAEGDLLSAQGGEGAAAAAAAASAANATTNATSATPAADADVPTERGRVAQLALWLLSLLALHSAPLALLLEHVRAEGTGYRIGAEQTGDAATRAEIGWEQVGIEPVAKPSPEAAAMLAALAVPDAHAPPLTPMWLRQGDKGTDLTMPAVHVRLQRAAFATLPEGEVGGEAAVDFAQLLSATTFPLEAVPHLTRFVIRRLPAMVASTAQPQSEQSAPTDSRQELLRLLNEQPSARQLKVLPPSGYS